MRCNFVFFLFAFVGFASSLSAQKIFFGEGNSSELINNAYELRMEEKYSESLELLNQVLEGDTNYYDALLERIVTLIELKEYEQALAACENGIASKQHQNHHIFRLNKGYVMSLKEDYESSIKIYSDLIQDYPFYINAHNNLASAFLQNKQYNEAYEQYKKMIVRFPYHAATHLNLGVFAYNEGHFTEAFLAFNTLIILEPESQRAYNVLVFLNDIAGNTKMDKSPKGDGFKLESREFEEIDLLIENYVALQSKYKLKSKSALNLGKQNHLIFSQLLQVPSTDYFYNKFYVPFFQKIMNE